MKREIDAIFSSPLRRAVQTAQIVAEPRGLPVTVMESFREINVGVLEQRGVTEEVWETYRQVIRDWINGKPETRFPGGENYHELWQRYQQGLQDITNQYPGQKLLVVGHGGIFTLTMPDLCPGTEILDLFKAETHNCALTKIQLKNDHGTITGKLIQWADASHLHGRAAELISGTPARGALKSDND
jgi:broad specificity phosphatase PhoE